MVSSKTKITEAELDSTKLYHPELMKDKICIITGGSNGGMLRQCAQAYLQHGAKAVILFSRKAEKNAAVAKELSQYGTCIGIQGDVRKPETCKACVDQVLSQFGRIDVLINGAAGNFLASAEKLSVNGFRTVIEIDTVGTFNMSQAVFKGYMKQHGGIIINISATLHWNGSIFQVHSASAKAGVDAITKVLACEWGPHGVRVNGIVPGFIAGTEGVARLGDLSNLNNKDATKSAMQSGTAEKKAESLASIVPSQRFGQVQDIANAALYLSSNSSHYVNGTNLLVDGGNYLTIPNFAFATPGFTEKWSQAKL